MIAPRDEYVVEPADGVSVDDFADLLASRMKAAPPKPMRSELGDTPTKGGGPVYYGGHDVYSMAGSTDADVATNLFLVQKILSVPDPRTGQPYRNEMGGPLVSDRLKHVMVSAAEKALGQAPAAIPETRDPDGFVTKSVGAWRSQIKAMTSTGTNTGDEWVPTFASSELWRDTHLQTTVGASVRRVNMPTNPFDLPTLETEPTWYYASTENTAVTEGTVGTDKATLTAKKIQCEVKFSGETEEDAIVAVVPELRRTLTRAAAQRIDDLIVSGDTETGGTGNVNSDDAAPAANSFYLALDGMRKFALVTNTAQKKQFSGAFTTALFTATRNLMLKYGARPSDVVCVMPPTTAYGVQDIDGFRYVYQYGPQATILTGEIAKIFGIPVLGYEAIPGTSTDLVDDDGKYTTTSVSTNDTDGWFVLFNKNHWTSGFRREIQIESWRDVSKDQNLLVASFRMGLIPSGISTAHTVAGYDITI